MKIPNYMSVQEAADKWDVTARQVQKMCSDGKIIDAIRFGRAWAIPNDIQKPTITRKVKPGPKRKIANKPCKMD